MKSIYFFSFSFSKGGAAIAANKFTRLANKSYAIKCVSADSVTSIDIKGCLKEESSGKVTACLHFLKRIISFLLLKLFSDKNQTKHSLNLFSSSVFIKKIVEAEKNSAVCNFHWINNDCLSLFRLDIIPKNSIITLHDEWLYCGAEHYYPVLAEDEQFSSGYFPFSNNVKGINWNWIAWTLKRRALRNRDDLIITVPSEWMYARAKRSVILRKNRIELLPNPIETNDFFPLTVAEVDHGRKELNISDDEIVIVIGAVDGNKNFIKGFSLLEQALVNISKDEIHIKNNKTRIVSFGGDKLDGSEYAGFPIIYAGRIDNTQCLRKIYGIADFTIVPSFAESFGQIAAESLACGTPVIGFRCSGLRDIIIHEDNGLLADPFCTDSLSRCITQMISYTSHRRRELGANGCRHVENKFSPDVVGKRYREIIESIK